MYRNKEDRDRISKAVMKDPQLKESKDPSKVPFDGKRMFWGGFESIIGLAAGHHSKSSTRRTAQGRYAKLCIAVESRCGAVAAVKVVGHHQLSGPGRFPSPPLRFHIPLIEPDVRY